MNIDHDKLESPARQICDSRRGAGHYDMPRTHRQHWRDLAAAQIGQKHGLSILDALMGIFGFKRAAK